jgi:hypothetical protein
MKAIEINGEIKTFGSVPKRWSDENGLHLNIGDGSAFGFKDVVTPTFDGRIENLDNLHLDGDVYTYDVVEITFSQTLAELKADKINTLKSAVGSRLFQTDWYIIREADSGEATPSDVRGERAALRTQSDSIEAEINALTTKKAVVLFDINL